MIMVVNPVLIGGAVFETVQTCDDSLTDTKFSSDHGEGVEHFTTGGSWLNKTTMNTLFLILICLVMIWCNVK